MPENIKLIVGSIGVILCISLFFLIISLINSQKHSVYNYNNSYDSAWWWLLLPAVLLIIMLFVLK